VAAVEGMFRSVLQRPRLPNNSSRKQLRLVCVADICAKSSILVQTLQYVQNVASY
jgi:hypothetical protein